jgi:hypothetical protein
MRQTLFVLFTALAVSGCGNDDLEVAASLERSTPERVQRYRFEPAIIWPDVIYEHTYIYTNKFDKPLSVVRFENAKPCCGTTGAVRPQALPPGGTLELKVTLKPSQGQINHRAILVTAEPSCPDVEFLTDAFFYPPGSIDEESGGPPTRVAVGRPSTCRLIASLYTDPDLSVSVR